MPLTLLVVAVGDRYATLSEMQFFLVEGSKFNATLICLFMVKFVLDKPQKVETILLLTACMRNYLVDKTHISNSRATERYSNRPLRYCFRTNYNWERDSAVTLRRQIYTRVEYNERRLERNEPISQDGESRNVYGS